MHRGLGVLFWLALLSVAWGTLRSAGDPPSSAVGGTLWQYFSGPMEGLVAVDPVSRLRVDDPIFFESPSGSWTQIGYVNSTSPVPNKNITLLWYSREVSSERCRLVQYRSTGRLDEVVAVMLPPEKQLQIQQHLSDLMREHGDELVAAFAPLVQQSLERSLPVVEEEFRIALDRHRDEIDRLVGRWNDDVIRDRLIPLARREILPTVRKHGEPQVEEIGRELWDRASIWRFGWRAVYDNSPLPRKNLVQEEWDRFVEEQAIPVFEARMDEIVVTLQKIVSDVAANSRVRAELAGVASEIAADEDARDLLRQILKETFVDSRRLREVWSSVWTSDDARRALDLAGNRLEPVVRKIGDELFGTQEDGIDPNFARVLRSQILGKDRRWVVATRVPTTVASEHRSSIPIIEVATDSMAYPIVYMADREERGSETE